MKNLLLLLLTTCFFACQQKENKNTSVPISPAIQIKKNKEQNNKIKEMNQQTGDTIVMNFINDKGLLIAKGSLDSIHPRIYVKFKNEASGELKAKIIPATGAGNIRFNQIIFPDKTSDGPYGMDLQADLKQKGNYILVIGHSQMADNPYFGKFEVQLENKKK